MKKYCLFYFILYLFVQSSVLEEENEVVGEEIYGPIVSYKFEGILYLIFSMRYERHSVIICLIYSFSLHEEHNVSSLLSIK
jgi:hypothetical protein